MSLGETFLRTLWTFQAISAAPVLIFCGMTAFTHFLNTIEVVYDFVTSLLTCVMAAGIVFIVLVQRQIPEERTPSHLTLRFEIGKAALATMLWLWMMLDMAFNPLNNYRFYDRTVRLQAVGFASILLLILYYPAVLYAVRQYTYRYRLPSSVALEETYVDSPLLPPQNPHSRFQRMFRRTSSIDESLV